MAAEAFLVYDEGVNKGKLKDNIKLALTDGNYHASKFTATQADDFLADWVVVAQRPNTLTGFSGTLFRCKRTDEARGLKEGELVLSMRSTEFIDDAVRDSASTNTLEVHDTGWAWGQISDMEAWYAQLKADPAMLGNKTFSVTGYSLGGHLATAFNLLRREDGTLGRVSNVITFNGAGVGEVKAGNTPQSVLAYFNKPWG